MSKVDPQYIKEVLALLKKQYPDAKIILNYKNTWELLVAVMLSAQCTDKMVNRVTAKLFKKYTTIEEYARADIAELEKDIYSTGFYRNKAKNLKAAARLILNTFGGQVPKTMEELITVPGVARKTANIVLGNAYTIYNGVAVDTHVFRVTKRLGFTDSNNTDRVEKDLMKVVPREWWFPMTYLLIEHGRAVCKAPLPKCNECFLNKICPSAFQFPNFQKS